MSTIKGNNATIIFKDETSNNASDLDTTALGSYTEFTGITSCSISVSNATFEATSITGPSSAATSRDFAVGTTATSMSLEGVYDPAQSNNADELFTKCKNKTRMGLFWENAQGGSNENKAVGGVGFCTSFELSAGMDDFVTFSASFELEGNPVVIDIS
jgi:hypothetical protein